MNKKAFTLVELLAVVTLIALLSLLVIPNITKNIGNKKGEISKANKKMLESATDMYIENHAINYTYTYEANGSTYCIPIQSLINENILETPIKDEQGKEIDYSKIIKATYSYIYNGFEYELVENNECTEIINYVSKPILESNMIPVVFNETINSWVKADINSKWYNYSEKNWANVVLVKELKENENSKTRQEYKDLPIGTKIEEEDILGHFVWIPRFRYQLFTSEEASEIKIVFENISAPKSQGKQVGEWLTHPAFTYNNNELSGIWVSKYEASNYNNNMIFKPNKNPWTNINYNDAYNVSQQIMVDNNIYGLSDVNSHLIQNSEWSAITYLTNSIYGINEKIDPKEESLTGKSTSTTGNITGIYDMSGLSNEYVVVQEETESSNGYSLIETNKWYNDNNEYITQSNPYLIRGTTSIFNYKNNALPNQNTSFRVTLINKDVSNELAFHRDEVITEGDGLYGTIDGTYVYKGSNPNNYIWLDENSDNQKIETELYRIISYEKDGTVKVIRNNSIGSMPWDSRTSETEGLRQNTSNTYCNYADPYYGCNVWGNNTNTYLNDTLIGTSFNYKYYENNTATNLTDHTYNGSVETNSTLNTYLNNDWLNKTSLSKYIEAHKFDVGGVNYFTTYTGGDKGITKEKTEESTYKWDGNIGLMNITEYVQASSNPECKSVYSNYYYNPSYYYDTAPNDDVNNQVQTITEINDWPCSNQEYNWLSLGINEWTITPLSKYRYSAWHIHNKGGLTHNRVYLNNEVRPSFFLKATVKLSGTGSIDNPYKIVSY